MRVRSNSGIASAEAPRRPVGVGEVVAGGQGVGVVGAQHPLAVGEGPLEQRDRLGQAPRRLVGGGEVVAGGQGVGVVGAQHPLAVGEGPLEQRDRLVQAPRRPVGVGEVAARGQGVGVVGTQDPLAVGGDTQPEFDGPGQVRGGPQLSHPPRPRAQLSGHDVGIIWRLNRRDLPQRLDLGHQLRAEVALTPGL